MIDTKSLSDECVIAQYVIELIGHGHFLSHEDYTRLEKWRAISSCSDELLLVLDEILPAKIEKYRQKGKKVLSLSSISKSVEKRLAERKMLTEGA